MRRRQTILIAIALHCVCWANAAHGQPITYEGCVDPRGIPVATGLVLVSVKGAKRRFAATVPTPTLHAVRCAVLRQNLFYSQPPLRRGLRTRFSRRTFRPMAGAEWNRWWSAHSRKR
jgi:hypothetical protein